MSKKQFPLYSKADYDKAMAANEKYEYRDHLGYYHKVTPAKYRSKSPKIFKKETYIEVDYNDLNTFISTVYNLSENFECHWEAANDSSTKFNVVDDELTPYEQKLVADMLANDGCTMSSLRVLLNDMCNKKLIKPGKYLVTINY